MYIYIHILFHYSLLQEIECSSLCCTVGPCCLSILYIIVGICYSQIPNPSLPTPSPSWQPQICSLCLWVCFCFMDKFIYVIFFPFFSLGLHLRHMEVPRLGAVLELQLLSYTTATAMPDPSCVFDLHRSSRQHQILNPLSHWARPGMELSSSWILIRFLTLWAATGTPMSYFRFYLWYHMVFVLLFLTYFT